MDERFPNVWCFDLRARLGGASSKLQLTRSFCLESEQVQAGIACRYVFYYNIVLAPRFAYRVLAIAYRLGTHL